MLDYVNLLSESVFVVLVLFLICGCHSMAYVREGDNFDMDYAGIVCPGKTETKDDLFELMMERIERHILEDDELGAAIGVINFQKPSYAGYGKVGDRYIVEFIFAQYIRHDVMLPGEGGVLVDIDSCSRTIVHSNFFRL